VTSPLEKALADIDKLKADIEPGEPDPIVFPPKGADPEPYIVLEMVRRGWARVLGGFIGDNIQVGPIYAGPIYAGPIYAGPIYAGPIYAGAIYNGATGDKRQAVESDYRHRREAIRQEFAAKAKGARPASIRAKKAIAYARTLIAEGYKKDAAAEEARTKFGVPFSTVRKGIQGPS